MTMKVRFFTVATIVFGICLFAEALFAEKTGSSSKPNVILIMADDLGYECIGANGSTSYQTPVLDSLAEGGIRFENCFSQPLCTPTRVQLMTGKYNIRNYTVFGELHRDQKTFGNFFRDAGYATSIVGKWQLGPDPTLPKHFGFDDYCLWQVTDRPSRYANPGLEINGKKIGYSDGEYGPDLVVDHALNFIENNKDRPFFLYYPMMLTHGPFQPTPKSAKWDPGHPKPGRSAIEHFSEMVSYMDYLIGRLVTKLDETGVRDNTLLVFLGDNGTASQIKSECNGKTLVGGKGKMTDAGTHVPLIVNAPGILKSEGVCDDLVDTTDFLPTLCEAAGIQLPSDFSTDGTSFYPRLDGRRGVPRDWVYFWFLRKDQEFRGKEQVAVRDKRYRLYATGEFYDVLADPSEEKPIPGNRMSEDQKTSRKNLESVLARFKDARPDWAWTKKNEDKVEKNRQNKRRQNQGAVRK